MTTVLSNGSAQRDSSTDANLVTDTLKAVSAETATLLDHYLTGRQPAEWLWELAANYPARGGKGIRPALCIEACLAFGGQAEQAIVSAASIELLHNAFLVHDDIEDESEERRGQPTLHELAGVPLALNAGDAMLLEAMSMLRDNRPLLGPQMSDWIVIEFERMLRFTLEGQAVELGWRRDRVIDLTEVDYLDLVVGKTCWYTTMHPLRVGAMIGGWQRTGLGPLTHFALYLGSAFQIQDDLLNLVGDEATYGKEILGDLFEGKRTLMLVHLLNALSETDRARLHTGFLSAPRAERTQTEAEAVLDMMHAHGSIDYARAFAEGIRQKAFETFEVAFGEVPDSPHRRFLHEMINFMLDRQL